LQTDQFLTSTLCTEGLKKHSGTKRALAKKPAQLKHEYSESELLVGEDLYAFDRLRINDTNDEDWKVIDELNDGFWNR